MPEITLHFDADAGADMAQIAAALRERAAALPEVDSAEVDAEPTRFGVPELLLALSVAGTVLSAGAAAMDGGAKALEALRRLIHAAKGVAEELGLRNVRVEVGLDQVPPEALTAEQAAKLAKG